MAAHSRGMGESEGLSWIMGASCYDVGSVGG